MNISDFCEAIEKPWYDRPAFRCDDFKGIALRFDSYCGYDDMDEEWEGGSYLESAIFHMVGDDREFRIEIEDIEILDDDEFCGGCGQIGCGHG